MASNFIFNYFINNVLNLTNSSLVQKGITVFRTHDIDIIDLAEDRRYGDLDVQSSSDPDLYYEVYYEMDYSGEIEELNCSCPYFRENGICKHIIGALFYVQNSAFNNKPLSNNATMLTIGKLHPEALSEIFFQKDLKLAKTLFNHHHVQILQYEGGKFECSVTEKEKQYKVSIQQPKKSNRTNVSCSCSKKGCVHSIASLYAIAIQHGEDALQQYLNWDNEKKQQLQQLGISTSLAEKSFEWYFKDANIHLRWKEETLPFNVDIQDISSLFKKSNAANMLGEKYIQYRVAYGFLNYQSYEDNPPFVFNTFLVKTGKSGKLLKTGSILVDDALEDKKWLQLATEHDKEIFFNIKKLGRITYQANTIQEQRQKYALFKNILMLIGNAPLFYFTQPVHYFGSPSAQKDFLELGEGEVSIKVKCTDHKGVIKITHHYFIDDQQVYPNFNEKNIIDESGFFVRINNKYHLWCSVEDSYLSELLAHCNEIGVGPEKWPEFFEKIIKPFTNQVEIKINTQQITIVPDTMNAVPEKRLVLSEMGGFLLLYPIVKYNDTEVNALEYGIKFLAKENKIIKRNKQTESELIQLISDTHPLFSPDTNQDYFHVPIDKIMEKNWFLNMYEQCKQNNISIYGLDKLKKINYSPVTPTVSYNFSSGTDWFDLKIDIEFEGQKISLKSLRKAVINNSNLIQLDDGKFGILPEEWLKKINAVLRFGKVNDDKVEMRKSQFALIHDLYDEITNEAMLEELAERRELLNQEIIIEKVTKPRALKGKLRHYQQDGLNWLVFLNKLGLGGCLADDMGLGKTIQMIGLITHLKQSMGKKYNCSLVVCPTTLLFNWEKELQKFAPSLKYTIHWGTSREVSSEIAEGNDVLLTTYGTLTNDIEHLRKVTFTLAVLDESQAIKNPESLRFKAVSLLKAQNRYVMTGTPIENNVTELYAQMQFINPGLLGSVNFFRKEFAGSIEKNRNPEKINDLRRLVNPFILQRTKEVVAKELPDKTEQVFLCEMKKEQRKVYDAFKEDIREKLMNSIASEGLAKARFTILEGLTKMRQICDSPALLSTQEGYGSESVKADELLQIIKEKMHLHKTLVFSQFLGMLKIIEDKLIAEGIKYVKLTGQTRNREKVVEAFEGDDECRVFLISLKAGGTGLNLVSADYVFLVDPWWNPAVENQAIDRAHRIGQTKKVFAYRMICKDTVEEKILKLQERKKTLSEDLISSDQSFISSLNSEDIKELFM